MFIFSDGRFPPVEEISLGNLQPQFLPLGTATAFNMGFIALNTRRGVENSDQIQVFAQVANASPEEAIAVVSLFHNGQLIDAMEVPMDAGGMGSATFLLDGDATGTLQAVLDPSADYQDRLALDNTAYAVIENRRHAQVLLITPGNSALELVLATERASRLAQVDMLTPAAIGTPEYERRIANVQYDLIIYDQCAPHELPPANTLLIGRRPPAAAWTAGQPPEETAAPQVIDWQRSHPLLSFVELGDLNIADSLIVPPPAGGRVLIDSTRGPLMAIAPRGRFEDVVLGFEIVSTNDEGARTFNTNWPLRHSFPSFWLNVLEYFAGDPGGQETHRPGELVEVRLSRTGRSVEVVDPDGTRVAVAVDSNGRLAFQETERPGIYQVFQDGIIVKQFAVNLFDPEETDVALRTDLVGDQGLEVVSSLKIGYVEVAARPANSDIRKELWKPLLLMVLVVLVVEWYIYNRRVYI